MEAIRFIFPTLGEHFTARSARNKKDFKGVVKHLVVNSAETEMKSQGRAERLRLPSKVIRVISVISVVRDRLSWPVILFYFFYSG